MACCRVNFTLYPFTINTFVFTFHVHCIPIVKHLWCKIFLAYCCCCYLKGAISVWIVGICVNPLLNLGYIGNPEPLKLSASWGGGWINLSALSNWWINAHKSTLHVQFYLHLNQFCDADGHKLLSWNPRMSLFWILLSMDIKANPECLSGGELWSVTIVFRAGNSLSTEIIL